MREKNFFIRRIIFIIVVFLMIVQINTYTLADVGSFEDYSSGSDWGSSSSSWSSSSSDWGSSYDWGSSSSDDYSWSSSSMLGFGVIITAIVLYVIIKHLYESNENDRANTIKYYSNTKPRINYNNAGVLETIRNVDPNFRKTEFESFAKETFIKLQNAWTDRDWEKIRPLETPELFEQHKAQLDGYIRNNQINVMDRICVNEMNLVSFTVEGEKDILVVDLNTRMADYIIDATTRAVIRGNRTKEYYHTYTLTFTRKTGTLTQIGNSNELKTTNCPNCGAPTNITSSGRCEYCNSIITTEDHGWVLASLKRRD